MKKAAVHWLAIEQSLSHNNGHIAADQPRLPSSYVKFVRGHVVTSKAVMRSDQFIFKFYRPVKLN